MSSELKVDTISEKTSAAGVTIDGLLIKDGAVPSITQNPAFSEVDMWVINTDLTSDHEPIGSTYFTRHTGTLINMPIGSGMAVASDGAWTFPSTGFYEVQFIANVENDTNSNATEIFIDATDDNFSSVDRIAYARFYGNDNSRTTYIATAIVDITNTTNDKVRFDFNEVNTSTLRGNANEFRSGVIFKKIAST